MLQALQSAVIRAEGILVTQDGGPEVLVSAVGPDRLEKVLRDTPSIRWVQLGGAGVDSYANLLNKSLIWTSAKGAYSAPVAEHALMLALAGLRGLTLRARAAEWGLQAGRSLHGTRCLVVGGGGIGTEIVRLLSVFATQVTVVRRDPKPVQGASRVMAFDHLEQLLPEADVLFLAAALTKETAGMLDSHRLRLLPPGAVVVNVARGALIDTDALVEALKTGHVAAAGLDVINPEPLPTGHPLWSDDRVLITPHTADTQEMIHVLLGARVEDNVRRWIAGQPLAGLVDTELGY